MGRVKPEIEAVLPIVEIALFKLQKSYVSGWTCGSPWPANDSTINPATPTPTAMFISLRFILFVPFVSLVSRPGDLLVTLMNTFLSLVQISQQIWWAARGSNLRPVD